MNQKNNHLFLLIAMALTIALSVTVYSIVDSPKYKSINAVEITTAIPTEETESETENVQPDIKININTATAEELEQLENIGRKKALAIVEYREANGPFKSIEELANVDGIGETTIELNIDRIIF